MSDAWISNASPLITLAAIDRLDLFAALKAEIRVPATVLNEVGAGASADRADDRVRASGRFVLVPDVAIETEVAHWGLDPGEAQAISQAIATAAKGVIQDDLAGRRCAQALGLRVIGTRSHRARQAIGHPHRSRAGDRRGSGCRLVHWRGPGARGARRTRRGVAAFSLHRRAHGTPRRAIP